MSKIIIPSHTILIYPKEEKVVSCNFTQCKIFRHDTIGKRKLSVLLLFEMLRKWYCCLIVKFK